jgi:hypothetical protein
MDENLDYPIPDPDWEYAQIWGNLQKNKSRIENLLKYMAEIENADDSTDSEIVAKLADVMSSLQIAYQFMQNFSGQA